MIQIKKEIFVEQKHEKNTVSISEILNVTLKTVQTFKLYLKIKKIKKLKMSRY